MTFFRVDLEQVESLLERMVALQTQLQDVHDDVSSRMGRLQVAWTGRAAAEHQLAYREWTQGAHEVGSALEVLERVARTAHGNYRAAVAANRAMWAT